MKQLAKIGAISLTMQTEHLPCESYLPRDPELVERAEFAARFMQNASYQEKKLLFGNI